MGFRAFNEDLKTAKGENIPQRSERTQDIKAVGHCSRNKGQTAAPLTESPRPCLLPPRLPTTWPPSSAIQRETLSDWLGKRQNPGD